jgi:ABC-type nitrate/sulfonate/bicarbonate transport system permease component
VRFAYAVGPRLVQLGFVAVLLLAWHVAAETKSVNPIILPPIGEVWARFVQIVDEGQYWAPLRVTVTELLSAIGISFPLGLLTGFLISRSTYAVRTFDPLITGIYAIPSIILLPIFVLYFGLGSPSKIAIGATLSFFPVTLNTIAGLSSVERIYISAARSMGASPFQMFWSVLVPAAFPVVLTGVRLGVIGAFLVILGAETISSLAGLGREIATQTELFDTPGVFAYIIFALLLALALNSTVLYLEAWGARRFGRAG